MTDIFITPGFEFQIGGLMTNFHLPKSTLMMLVAAVMGRRPDHGRIYAHAIAQNYRFFSYGDSSLLLP